MRHSEPALRADAQRNLERILHAAGQIFIDHGLNAPMESIAREAGVGVGTLYRRFPSRQALLVAVLAKETGWMTAEARDALAQEATTWAALIRFTRRVAARRAGFALFVADQGLCALDQDLTHSTTALRQLLDEIVTGAHAEGMLRPDVTPTCLVGIIGLLARHPADGGRAMAVPADQLTEIILSGLKAGPPPAH